MADPMGTAALVAAERRYHGKHRGIVADNEDPQGIGRVLVQVPAVLGAETAWALPCLPFGGSPDSGQFTVPEVGANVWVEFEGGDVSHPVWVGTFWAPGQVGDQGGIGDWRVRTLRTAGGQRLSLDDTEGATSILLRHTTDAELVIDDDGTITLTDAAGNVVTLDAGAAELRLEDANGNSVVASASGLRLDDGQGASVELSGPSVTISATTVTVDAALVQLAGGGEPVLKGTSFLTAYMAHTHPTGAGPSGPPIPTTESAALSSKVQTG